MLPVRKQVVLWKFLEELLDTNENNCVSWVSREEGTFRFVDSKLAAKLWGQRKNKRNMTYEKLSRALRYYYDRQIMFHEEGQKLIYRFGDIVMKNRKPSAVEASQRDMNIKMTLNCQNIANGELKYHFVSRLLIRRETGSMIYC